MSHASALKLVEVLQGEKVPNVQPTSPMVKRWVRQGVTPKDLKSAISKARQRRADAGSCAPINIGLIDTIVTQDGKAAEADWIKRGGDVGISPQAGESWPAYRRRVRQAEEDANAAH